MAKPKLSGSLLTDKNAGLTTERERRPTLRAKGDHSFAYPAANSTSSLFHEPGGQRSSPALRTGFAICGGLVAAFVGFVFLARPSERISEPVAALNSNPPSPSALASVQNYQGAEAKPASQATAASVGSVEKSILPSATPAPATTPAPAISASRQDDLPAISTTARHSEPLTSAAAPSQEHQSADSFPTTDVRLSAAEISALRARGDALFGSGDVISARLFYERAAEAGDGQAALQLGETFDPAFLKQAGIIGIRGDSTTAEHWYQGALALGASQAQVLLKSSTDR